MYSWTRHLISGRNFLTLAKNLRQSDASVRGFNPTRTVNRYNRHPRPFLSKPTDGRRITDPTTRTSNREGPYFISATPRPSQGPRPPTSISETLPGRAFNAVAPQTGRRALDVGPMQQDLSGNSNYDTETLPPDYGQLFNKLT